ncbi:hypothetical protein RRF57_003455 [Xylaria bambusicola]|uniref:Uncharacterized protein n=1 Tax=Xylaria bambusicola TaxID=326684 RepID=A0AAN7YWD3_9PEZI
MAMAEHEDEIEGDYNATVKGLQDLLTFDPVFSTMSLGIPTDGRFKYPAEKRRSESTVNAMRKAERALDKFWTEMQRDLEKSGAMTPRLRNTFIRSVERTPEWVEPIKCITPSIADASLNNFVAPFGGLSTEHETNDVSIDQSKSKVKTRGIARATLTDVLEVPRPDITEPVEQQPLFKLDQRALKVFNSLFFNPLASSRPGEIPWTEFLRAMHIIGFSAEKLQGSAWRFTPSHVDAKCSIQIHQPHPGSKLPLVTARRIGRRLSKAYGWQGHIFIPS